MTGDTPPLANALRRRLRNLPIAKKLTLFSVMVSLACLLLAFVAVVGYQEYSIETNLSAELSVQASVLSDRATEAIVLDDYDLARFTLQALKLRKNITAACLYKVSAETAHSRLVTVIARYPTAETPCAGAADGEHDVYARPAPDSRSLLHPIKLGDDVLGYIYLERDIRQIEALRTKLIAFLLLIVSGGVLISLWLAHSFSQWMVAPLRALGRTASTIAGTDDYTVRATRYGDDEVGQVVDSFNQMLATIENENAKLRDSEEKFRLISASLKAGVFQLDPDGRCLFVNDALAQITGISVDEILTNNWLQTIHNDDFPLVEGKWNDMLAKQCAIAINCRIRGAKIRWINGHVEPMHSVDGRVIGFLGTINDITEVKNAQLQLEQMAFYDTLTGLANRRLFRKRLENVIDNTSRRSAGVGLVLIDVDHFKNTNDSMGHDAGDSLLRVIAERLQECVRASDTVARLGGDEFAIILPGISAGRAIESIVRKILDTLQKPTVVNEAEVRITASAGVAIAPMDARDAETLIKHADLALYQAKESGRNTYQFFTAAMNTQLLDHLALIRDLREAVEGEHFHLVFQPQVNLKTRQLIGFEALLRWQHTARGLVSPLNFIPVAEETGMIIPLGRWVITHACRQLQQLLAKGLISESAVITVNLSAWQFQDANLVDFIQQQLRDHDLSPRQFEVELTETVLMENLDEIVDKLDALRDIGVLISIDDFGTGYSSLGYLKKLPVHIVKVDRSFVADIPNNNDDMEITAAVIAMAHSLNYEVVAEGVETEAQLVFLEQCGCDFGQGYLFGKPLDEAELYEYCASFADNNYLSTRAGRQA